MARSWELSRSASREPAGCRVAGPALLSYFPMGGLSIQIATWKFLEVFLSSLLINRKQCG